MSEFEEAARRNEAAARKAAAENAARHEAALRAERERQREQDADEAIRREQRTRLEKAKEEFLAATAKLGAQGGDWRSRWPGGAPWKISDDVYLTASGEWQRYSTGSSYDGTSGGYYAVDPLSRWRLDGIRTFVDSAIATLGMLYGELRLTVNGEASTTPRAEGGHEDAAEQRMLWDEATAFAAEHKAHAVRAQNTVIITRKSLFGEKVWRARIDPSGQVEIKRK